MPQLGETVTEGTITKWYKAVGDRVARDEPLFEVSTDKVDSEVPSPAEGVLTAILVDEGDTVDVGVTLAVISDGAAANGAAPSAGGAAEARPAPSAPDRDVELPATPPASAGTPVVAPVPPAVAPETPPSTALSVPTAPSPPEVRGLDPGPSLRPAPSGAMAGSAPGLVLSPMVRRLLDEHRLDPATINGTGLGGRITRGDVESVIAGAGAGAAADPVAPPSAVPSIADGRASALLTVPPPPVPPVETGAVPAAAAPSPAPTPRPWVTAPGSARDEVVPFTNIRRRTAEHMVRSKATSAHTLMVKEVDYERVEQVRRVHGERFRAEEGFSLSYLPFAALATVEALAEFPHLNASVGDDVLIVHHDVNLGIAVDLDNEGLIVPVIHNAEELNLRGMARRIRDLADRARTKRLALDDISGGTFSITNAGPFGTLLTGAIINQPQVAILSTDGVTRRPVVVELPDGTESIAIHSVGLAAMTFDHRAVDGAYVARFLARLSGLLNDRDWAGEL
jgi:pyruvate dehydrogenase E2 component (dihydrolipoamide acetyltransferase)